MADIVVWFLICPSASVAAFLFRCPSDSKCWLILGGFSAQIQYDITYWTEQFATISMKSAIRVLLHMMYGRNVLCFVDRLPTYPDLKYSSQLHCAACSVSLNPPSLPCCPMIGLISMLIGSIIEPGWETLYFLCSTGAPGKGFPCFLYSLLVAAHLQ